MLLPHNLSKKILAWYDNNRRKLPWRVSKKSKKKLYYRLLSEFMLQQTQVKTVIPYFKKFLLHYPTLELLSKSNEKKVEQLIWMELLNCEESHYFQLNELISKKEKYQKQSKRYFDTSNAIRDIQNKIRSAQVKVKIKVKIKNRIKETFVVNAY